MLQALNSPFVMLGTIGTGVALVTALRLTGLLVLDDSWYIVAAPTGGGGGDGIFSFLGLLPLFQPTEVHVGLLVAALPQVSTL